MKNIQRLLILCFLCFWGVQRLTAQWVQTNGPYGGYIGCIAVASNGDGGTNLFAGNAGGIFYSQNNGNNWKAINTGLTNHYINVLAINGTTVFAGTRYGVFVSTNNGINWNLTDSRFANQDVEQLAFSGNNLLAGTWDAGVFRSTNNGASWTQVNSGLTNMRVMELLVQGTNIFAATSGGIFLSTNNGSNWTSVSNGLTDKYIMSLTCNGPNLFAGSLNGGIYMSNNNGASWNQTNAGLKNYCILSLTVSRNNVFAGTSNGIFLSTNNGAVWTEVSTGLVSKEIHSLAVYDFTVFAGTKAGMFISANNGTSWKEINNELNGSNILTLAENGEKIFAGTEGGGVYTSTNNGSSWTQSNSGLTSLDVYSFAVKGTDIFVGTWDGSVYRSSNDGISWTRSSAGLTGTGVYCLAINGGNLFAGTWNEGIFRSSDNGASWMKINSGINDNCVFTIAVCGSNIFAGNWDGVYISTNNGDTWKITRLSNKYVRSLAVIGSSIFAGVYGEGIYCSTNNGIEWSLVGSSLVDPYIWALCVSGAALFAGTDKDIYYSTDNGKSWASTGWTGTEVRSLAVSKSYLFTGASYHSVWKQPISELIKKTPVVFIPGVMGSPLYNNNQEPSYSLYNSNAIGGAFEDEFIWADADQIGLNLAGDRFLDVLQLDKDGERPLDPENKIVVSPLYNDTFNKIRDELKHLPLSYCQGLIEDELEKVDKYTLNDFNDENKEEENLYVFTYDWRKSNQSNAELLKELIDKITDVHKCSKVNIIVHSMGGILAKSYISQYGGKKIKKIVFIATPHLGAPKVLHMMATGAIDGAFIDLAINTLELKNISRNFSSAYELMPSMMYTNPDYNNGISKESDLYNSCLFSEKTTNLKLDSKSYDYQGMLDFYKSLSFNDGFTFNSYLLNKGDSFRKTIDNLDFSGIEVYNIVGTNESTIGKVTFNNNVSSSNLDQAMADYILNGDGTVPLKSAECISRKKIKDLHTYYVKDIDHNDLPSSEPIRKIISGILNEPAIVDFPGNEDISVKPPEHYAAPNIFQSLLDCPVELHAYDSLGRHTGPISKDKWEENIPGSKYMIADLRDPDSKKIIILPQDGNYAYKIISQDTSAHFNFKINKIINGNTSISFQFDSIQTKPNTVAVCSIARNSEIIRMDIDYDGNGTIDKVITSTVLTGIKEENKKNLPAIYNLSQNYPNPFNPVTTIVYSIPENRNVKLIIYDLLGNEITKLVNENKNAGNYSVQFDGTNLPSGVYFYRLEVEGYTAAKKFILIK